MTGESHRVVFHGSEEEAKALLAALERNCSCEMRAGQKVLCAGHKALLSDQHFVDWLLFLRRAGRRD